MGKVFKGLGWVLLGSLVVYLVLFTYGRLRGPTPEQAKAMALLDEKPVFDPATDADAYIWLLEYDVPQALEAEITARDIARYNALTDMKAITAFQSEAEGRYPKLDMSPSALDGFCHEGADKPCLQKVAEQHLDVKQALAKHAKALEKAKRIRDYRSHYYGFKLHIAGMIPAYNPGHSLLRVHYADVFLDGKRYEAMDGMCRDLQAWRSISANTNTLVGAMVGQAYSRQRLGMLAEMLQAMPASEAIPVSCAQALQPGPMKERSICNAVAGESKLIQDLEVTLKSEPIEDNVKARIGQSILPLTYSTELTQRGLATSYAAPCSQQALDSVARDEPMGSMVRSDKAETQCDLPAWAANPLGCYFSGNTMPSYFDYHARRLDFAAQLEAARILLWLREHPEAGADIATLFANRPKELREFEKRVRLSDDGGAIIVTLHAPRPTDDADGWRLAIATESTLGKKD